MSAKSLYQNEKAVELRRAMSKGSRAIVSELQASDRPLSVGDLLDRLAREGIRMNKTTAYRNLVRLLADGRIEEVLLSGDRHFYELSKAHHHHFVCLLCHEVTDWVPDESLLAQEERRLNKCGFFVQRHTLEFFGTCMRCSRLRSE